jgi:hypothetical protein
MCVQGQEFQVKISYKMRSLLTRNYPLGKIITKNATISIFTITR